MKATKLLITVALLLSVGTTVSAQSAVPAGRGNAAVVTSYPGSVWVVLGNLSPVEHSNIQFSGYAEQGVSLFHHGRFTLVPYGSLNLGADTFGFDWNNNIKLSGGAKVNISVPHGIVSIGATYTFEHRFESGMQAAAPTYYISDWFGWNAKSRYPGSTWAILGEVSPVEKGNVIASGYVQQGVVVKTIGPIKLVPFAVLTASKDTLGNTWNNFVRPGGGMDIALPHGLDLEALYLHEMRPGLGVSTGEFSLALKFWYGWAFKGGKH
jgi:hypothetical protein